VSSISTAILEEQGDFVLAKALSIALIGPEEPRRSAVSSVLAEYPAIQLCEFSSYPTHLDTVSRLLAREFDIIIVDLDSNPKVALGLVEGIRGEGTATVIPYTEEADPEVMTRCMRAGAREYLVLPVRRSTLDRIFARARIGLPAGAQPAAKPGPQVIAVTKTTVLQNEPSTVLQNEPSTTGAPVRAEDEDLRQRSKQAPAQGSQPASGQAPAQASEQGSQPASAQASGPASAQASRPLSGPVSSPVLGVAALDRQPAAASRETEADLGFSHVSSSRRWPGGVIVEEIRFTPEPQPLAARPDDEAPLQKLKAPDTVSGGRSAAASQWATFFSVVAVAPVISNHAVEAAEEPGDVLVHSRKASAIVTDHETASLSFHSDLADLGDEDPDRKKWVRVGAVSFAALVLLLFVGPRLFTPAKHTLAAQSAQTSPVANDPEPEAKTLKPRPSRPLDESHRAATGDARQALHPQSATNVEEAIWPNADSKLATTHGSELSTQGAAPQVDSTLMNEQLASAPRIPQDVKVRHKEEAPPSAGFEAANTEGMGSGAVVVGSIFSGQQRPTVKYLPPPPVVISINAAEKLLIHKTLPVYPRSAWNHYISGKVVLEAVVSETGSVESLRVVSGPKVFEQAALDAVKTWRYKPYVVNDRPARVQTTVTLTFDPYR
jgi:TonB family protein